VIPVGEAGVANLLMETKFVNFHLLAAFHQCKSLAIHWEIAHHPFLQHLDASTKKREQCTLSGEIV
jgi:hypothetical protein